MEPSGPSPFLDGDDEVSTPDTMQFVRAPAAVTRQRPPTLRVVAGADLMLHVSLYPGDVVVIGRDPQAGLRLPHGSVSKRHLEVSVGLDGKVRARDLGSTNGTAVNHQPFSEGPLSSGDLLLIGEVELRLEHLPAEEVERLRRLHQRLAQADRDALTGLLTRAWLNDELDGLAERAEAQGAPLSCVYVDIDHFKRVNDTYGHATGDEVITTVARILLMTVREGDPCVRYGGEELVVFLPQTGPAAAAEIAERVRARIEAHAWERTAPGLLVTASFGVATRRVHEPTAAWRERADQALYAAKRSGRNRVQIAP